MSKRMMVMISAAVTLVLLLSGCSGSANQKGETAPDNQDVMIETSFGTVSYPYGFEEIVKYEMVSGTDTEQYDFYAVVDGEEIKVYSILFAGHLIQDAGDLLGSVKDGEGKNAYVYFAPEDDIEDDSLSEENQKIVYAAQETCNDVIASIHAMKTFVNEAG